MLWHDMNARASSKEKFCGILPKRKIGQSFLWGKKFELITFFFACVFEVQGKHVYCFLEENIIPSLKPDTIAENITPPLIPDNIAVINTGSFAMLPTPK